MKLQQILESTKHFLFGMEGYKLREAYRYSQLNRRIELEKLKVESRESEEKEDEIQAA